MTLQDRIEMYLVILTPNLVHSIILSLQKSQLPKKEEKVLNDAIGEYEELIKHQEMMRCQEFKVNWLKYGDRNTFFFFMLLLLY